MSGESVAYQLKSYVRFTGTGGRKGELFYGGPDGQFLAIFEESGAWFRAGEGQVVQLPDSAPHAWPYLCFFEKEGASADAVAWSPRECAVT